MTIDELRKQAYVLYLHDMECLHPGVKPVTFAVFCEHAKKGWGK